MTSVIRYLFRLGVKTAPYTLLIALAFAGGNAVAQPDRPSKTDTKSQTELMQLERDIGRANINRDKAFFLRVEADEFIFTDSAGGTTTKAEDVASLDKPAGELKLVSYDLDGMRVMVYGAAAVVTGTVITTSRGNAREVTNKSRFTDVFVKRDGRWQLVAGHSSRIRDPQPIAAQDSGSRSEPVSFSNGAVTLKGTLYLPGGVGHHPAIVAYHAANEPTRDFPIYQDLARQLTASGTAVLIFDRRGSGESTGDFEAASFADLATDGIAGINYLKSRSDIDTEHIGVWGVSQGGWIAPLAATMSKDIKFVVMVSGCGVTPAKQMTYGAEFALREGKYSNDVIGRAKHLRASLDDYYRGNGDRNKVQAEIETARGEPWFPLAFLPNGGKLPDMPSETKWYLEMDFDPSPILAKVHVPMLAFFGETDRWVPIDRSIARMSEANRNIEFHRVPGADHLMNIGGTGSDAKISAEYGTMMVAWVRHRGSDSTATLH